MENSTGLVPSPLEPREPELWRFEVSRQGSNKSRIYVNKYEKAPTASLPEVCAERRVQRWSKSSSSGAAFMLGPRPRTDAEPTCFVNVISVLFSCRWLRRSFRISIDVPYCLVTFRKFLGSRSRCHPRALGVPRMLLSRRNDCELLCYCPFSYVPLQMINLFAPLLKLRTFATRAHEALGDLGLVQSCSPWKVLLAGSL